MNPLPQHEDYEQNILGNILQVGTLIEKISSLLSTEDFYVTKHQIIFRTMLEMRNSNIPIDELSLCEELEKKGLSDDAGGLSYLGYLRDTAISPANIDYHAKKVKEASYIRNVKEEGYRLYEAENIEEIERHLQRLDEVSLQSEESRIISLADYKAQPMTWLLENAIPDKFPTTIYGDGGLGKSYVGLYFATLAAIGEQSFLGLNFPREPLNVLYLD